MASQTRDKILKEGLVRYRQSTIALQKWRSRHLVFKVTHAGRLQLIVYKESPATAANEIKEIAIDEFGGLEHNLKLDSEKYVFAIITTNVTECFSTESPHDLTDWRQLLQEYLGKELVVSINIPPKQHLLKAGKGSLRIRNTGFTITSCENPPRCQGTWHIIHIRKYGGTDMFRFQTGSKCPTGEFLYSIEAKDNVGIKKLFNDLSNHRPIFADDRLGRRMTLERNFHTTTPSSTHSPSRTGNNRLSLQAANRSSEKPLYENREHFHTMQSRHNSSDLTVPYPMDRRASFDDGFLELQKAETGRQSTPSHKLPSQEDDKLYQNIHPSTPQRFSPTKKSHFSPVSVPVPDGYYNLTPPTLVRCHNNSNNVSPSSSPEENSLSLFNPHIAETSHGQELSIVGDSLIMNKSAHPLSKTLSPPSEGTDTGGTYQNVEFMRADNHGAKSRNEIFANDEIAPIIPATITEEPWSPHNYTNVAFAKATAQGQSTAQHTASSKPKNGKARKNRPNAPLQKTWSSGYGYLGNQSKTERKVSMPATFASRDSPLRSTPSQTLVVSTSSDDLLSPSPSSIESAPVLRNSHSDMELNSSSKDKSLNYYNYCAPSLPAHSKASNKSLSLRSKLTLSSGHRVLQSNDSLHSHKSAEILSPDVPDGALNYSKLSRIRQSAESASDSDILSPPYASIDDFKVKLRAVANGGDDKMTLRSASCDCLDSREPTTRSLAPRESRRPDSHNAIYDKLGPLQDANTSMYDSLGLSKDDFLSGSSSPDPCDDPSIDLKANYLRRPHKYEYIDVELESRSSESTSPIGMENPSNWTTSLLLGFTRREARPRASTNKDTKTLSRRKQLPLQEQLSTETEYSAVKTAKPPRLSRDNSAEVPKSMSLSVNVSRVSQATSSVDSTEIVSSSDSTKRESVFSDGSSSSVELDMKTSNSALEQVRREHSNSPSHRVTREDVSIRIRNLRSESPQDHTDSQPQSPSDEPPPIPKKGLAEPPSPPANGSPPLPPRSQEQPRFTVPLPQAKFDFVKPPPPKPKMLCPSDLSYAAVTFANGEKPIYSHVEPVIRSNRPSMRIAQTHSDVSYVAVDFQMTAGLQRTSEQVADHHREFFETQQQS